MGNPLSAQHKCPHCELAYDPNFYESDACLNCGGSLSTPGLPKDVDPDFDKPKPIGEENDAKFLKSVGIRAKKKSLLMKDAAGRYIDDEWREILEANGYQPRTEPDVKRRGSGYDQEIWSNPNTDLQISIGHMDDGGDPFWATISPDGMDVEGTDTEDLLEVIGEAHADKSEPTPRDPEQEKKDDTDMLKSMGIIGRQRTVRGKQAGKPPRFSFSVPMEAAGKVAYHLAKAGVKDFEVVNFEGDGTSVFAFTNEPTLHVGEEIIRAEFAAQISAEKGIWASWTSHPEDPSVVKPERDLDHAPVLSSEKTADGMNLQKAIDAFQQLVDGYDDEMGGSAFLGEQYEAIEFLKSLESPTPPQHPEEGFLRGE